MPSDDFTRLSTLVQRPSILARWEHLRHRQAHPFIEMTAEAVGVFLYCYCGGSVTAAWVLGTLAGLEGVGSVLTIGFGYAMGIVLALVICSSTSGGHFNPCVTIAQVLFRGFPVRKAPLFIISQLIGAYIAFGLIYVQYRDLILLGEEILMAKGPAVYAASMYQSTGPAGIFGLYVNPHFHLGNIFINEFVVDFMLGLTIWACLDPTNFFIPPVAAPWIIAMAYAVAIWGFSPVGIAANTARDLGGRLMAMTIWGSAASGGTYAAIAALTNIPATLLAVVFYEFVFWDSSRVLNPATRSFLGAHKAHAEELSNIRGDLLTRRPTMNSVAEPEQRSTDKNSAVTDHRETV